MAAYLRSGAAEDARRKQPGGAIAEMKFAPGEACRVAEQPGHGVASARRIFQTFTQYHVAAALAVHRTRLGETPQSGRKCSRASQRVGMQLRIAAGQPAAVGSGRRRLVRKR